MQKNSRKLILRTLVSYSLALLVTFLFVFLLKANISPLLILFLIGFKLNLDLISILNKRIISKICKYLAIGYIIIFAIILFTEILITPFSTYSIWLQNIYDMPKDSFISGLFVLLVCFFSSIFCGSLITKKSYKSLMVFASLIIAVLGIIYRSPLFFSFFIIILILYILINMRHGYVLCVFVMIISVIIGITGIFSSGMPSGSAFISTFVYPQLRNIIKNIFPQYPLLFGIPGYGFTFNTGHLGGKVVPTQNPVFEVYDETRKTFYLRTRIYDTYLGNSWAQSENLNRKMNPMAEKENNFKSQTEIKILMDFYNYIPHTMDTDIIRIKDNYYKLPSKDTWAGHFFKKPLKRDDIIYISYIEKQEKQPLENPQNYLEVPPALQDSLKDLADRLGAGYTNPTSILSNIKYYLSQNNEYNLNAPVLQPQEDIVEKFLFDNKKGYCVHFSTAFALLARLNNIPSRYIVGYLVQIPYDKKRTVVTGYSSHAWVETWIEGKGWTRWEPTAAVDPGEYYEYYYGNYDSYTLKQLNAIRGVKMIPPVEEIARPLQIDFNIYYVFYILLILLALIFLLLNGYRFTFILKNKKIPCTLLIKRIVRINRQYSNIEEIGWVHWILLSKRILPEIQKELDKLLFIILKLFYSTQEATHNDLSFIFSIYKRMRRVKRKKSRNV